MLLTCHDKGHVLLTVHGHHVYHQDRLVLFPVPGPTLLACGRLGFPRSSISKEMKAEGSLGRALGINTCAQNRGKQMQETRSVQASHQPQPSPRPLQLGQLFEAVLSWPR